MKSFFPEEKGKVEDALLHSASSALKKYQTITFTLAWAFSSLVVLGDISCWGGSLSIKSERLNMDIGTQVVGLGGTLVYRGGIELTSRDSRFGGLSGLLVSQNGNRALAISDRGWWLQGYLVYNQWGDLVGVRDMNILPMRSLEASSKFTLDAEAIVQTGEGDLIVAYERQHRLWSYSDVFSRPTPINMGKSLSNLPHNSGIESLVLMAPGEFLAITENGVGESNFAAFYKTKSGVSRVEYPYDSYFRPSDAVRIAQNSFLVLERGYNREVGVGARLVLAELRTLNENFEITKDVLVNLRWPIPLDNFEGLAITSGPTKPATVYLLSDDNYSKDQRTLLMMFELEISLPIQYLKKTNLQRP
tara:strand:+ start:409 stop:1491 length:1083 start_codon:yes stop_codon:yes gene_type:complete